MKLYLALPLVTLFFCFAQGKDIVYFHQSNFFLNSAQDSQEKQQLTALLENGHKVLANASKALDELKHDKLGYLTTMLEHHICSLNSVLVYANEHFANKSLAKSYLMHRVEADIQFLEHQLLNEIELIRLAVASSGHHSGVTSQIFSAKAEDLLKTGQNLLNSRENSREYAMIAKEVDHLEKMTKSLKTEVSHDAEKLKEVEHNLVRTKLSLQVLADKTKWHLPCKLQPELSSN